VVIVPWTHLFCLCSNNNDDDNNNNTVYVNVLVRNWCYQLIAILSGQTVPSPSRLTLFGNRIFWSDGTKQGIMSINKYQGHNSIQVVYRKREVREPKGVKAVHGLIQLYGNTHVAILSHKLSHYL
jgi:hypothetical protein